ncbi:hypothetical protein [Microvirga roseola]|uniref:hypothetical protein n=1 Tax=Microvirga roseola TaxID=2883126 RepID=UPI001E439EED|nr:hypothetical protein [Microvirga roseola]
MRSRNWIALLAVALLIVAMSTVLWVVFVDRDDPPGATGAIPGAETPATATPVTPETPGRVP